MKHSPLRLVKILLLATFAFLALPVFTYAVHPVSSAESTGVKDCTSVLFAPLTFSQLSEMSRSEVEVALNRHLKFKERRILTKLKHLVNRHDKVNPEKANGDACFEMERKAANAVLFGILGLLIAGIIFGILAIVAGSNAQKYADHYPDCENAKHSHSKGTVGIVLGVIDIIGAITVLAILL